MRRLAAGAAMTAVVLAAAVWAQNLFVSQANNEVRIRAPNFHFLMGKPLDRMRSGNAVGFDFQLSALGDGKTNVITRSFERYVISYDLWEQTYSVSRPKRGQANHLTSEQAENWCIAGITLPASALPKNEPLWFRLEVQAHNGNVRDPMFEEPGLSIAQLIDVFSRAARPKGSDYWRVEAGPIRLDARGSR